MDTHRPDRGGPNDRLLDKLLHRKKPVVTQPAVEFVVATNLYERTTIVIDRFWDGTKELARHDVITVRPPCQTGGCRATSPDQTQCAFDPKTGLCDGKLA